MDEATLTQQQYYIATRSAPTDDHARVLKYGSMFAVFDRLGDISRQGLGEQGIFYEGTRYLSELSLRLWSERPLLLSSTIEPNNFLFTADLANLDVSRGDSVAIHRGTLHLLRSRFLWRAAAYEELEFVNYGMHTLQVPFAVLFAADFADIFEVRGTPRERKGMQLHERSGENWIALGYEGLDSITRTMRIQSEPAPHAIVGPEMRWELELEPRQPHRFHIYMECEKNGGTSGTKRSVGYSQAMRRAHTELNASAQQFPQIHSSNSRFNDWMTRSLADVQMMTIGNRERNFPYAGVPWFSTVFGRDGIVTALETLWIDPSIAKGVLEYLAETQATEVDESREAEPGKILHELRHGEMANLGEIPFARYYGSVDATPLFVMLAGEYFLRTGDKELIRQLWPHIHAALDWINKYGDLDGDGFVEYAPHGNKGLVQQGWKDSSDSVFHADGSLAVAPIALCEVQGYVYAAKLAAAQLAGALGNRSACTELESQAAVLREKFEQTFWCEDLGTYALALDAGKHKQKQLCRVRTSNAGQCLYTGIASPEHARAIAHGLIEKDFFSGWGIRTLARGEPRYNPLSYHNGSVWPHDNAIIASGLARYGLRNLAGKVMLSLLDVSSVMELHRLPELFCGLERRPGEGPTLYPVACSPQAWAAAAPFLLIQACLGLRIEGAQNRVVFERPYLPEGIPQLSIRGLRVGNASVDLFFERQAENVRVQVLEKQGEVDVIATL
ncbi:MAG TPA: amylo-alpha-1,6-glucosidase [Terriglobales bacterium]|nr:amylo-alpha-1,6-glucosidase [Terriglobales bacterium]